MSEQQQLTLDVASRSLKTFENFWFSKNQEVYASLKGWARVSPAKAESFLYLHGANSSGRSHLIEAVCHEAGQWGWRSAYVPLSDPDLQPSILEGLETVDRVCIDDVDAVAGDADWEEALFHVFNRLREYSVPLIVTGSVAPAHLDIRLADLKSRLQSGISYRLQVLDDEEKRLILKRQANERGFELNDDVSQFIVLRAPRSMGDLIAVLDRLDRASLEAKRKLTVPFVKSVLDW